MNDNDFDLPLKDFDLLSALHSMESMDTVIREDYVRAPFGYPGSKSKSIKNILPHLPYTNMYCEPFGGSGSVLLARRASKLEIFNDRYSGVTSFYRVMRDEALMNKLVQRLEYIIHSREEFIWSRNTWKDCDDLVERAARWYYTVRCSFGSQALFFGRSKNPSATFAPKLQKGLELFYDIHKRIAETVQIENLDWRVCFNDYNRPECVWYLDPPYYRATKGMFEIEFADSEHRELLERIDHLDGFVAISGYPNDLYDKYHWDERYVWEQCSTTLGIAFTQSNGCAGYEELLSRKAAMEVLYIRYPK